MNEDMKHADLPPAVFTGPQPMKRLIEGARYQPGARPISRDEALNEMVRLSAKLVVAKEALRDLLEAVDLIVNPEVTKVMGDGTLDLINAVRKGKSALVRLDAPLG